MLIEYNRTNAFRPSVLLIMLLLHLLYAALILDCLLFSLLIWHIGSGTKSRGQNVLESNGRKTTPFDQIDRKGLHNNSSNDLAAF